jgi:predicted MFS family arabinose efflux permease
MGQQMGQQMGQVVRGGASVVERESALWLMAVILLGAVAVSVFLYMPIVAEALSYEFHFTPQLVGEFSSLQLIAISGGCFLNVYLTRMFGVRVIGAIALGILLSMDFASPFIRNYPVFLLSRGIAGLAGGVAVSLTTGLLAKSSRPERGFGFFLMLQISLKIFALWFLPKVVLAFGLHGLFDFMAAFDALTLCGVLAVLPSQVLYRPSSTPAAGAKNQPRDWLLCGAVLLGILALFNAIGGFWTYVALIGVQSGLSPQSVGTALSLSTFGGLIGALVPVLLQSRRGHIAPVLFASMAMLGALYLLMHAGTFGAYVLATGGFCFGWYMLSPYQLSVLAALDRDGRPSVVSAALTGLGLGIGPAIVSIFANSGLSAAYVVGAVGVALSAVLTAMASILGRSAARHEVPSAALGGSLS